MNPTTNVISGQEPATQPSSYPQESSGPAATQMINTQQYTTTQHSTQPYTTQSYTYSSAPMQTTTQYSSAPMQTTTKYATTQYTTGQPIQSSTQYATTSQVVGGGVTSNTTSGDHESHRQSSVVGREYGEQRLISVTETVDESRKQIIREGYVEKTVMIPKRVVREEVIEKYVVVPETIRREDIVEESHKVREKVIEISKPTIVEKVIEVPEIEVVEKLEYYDVPEVVYNDELVPYDVYPDGQRADGFVDGGVEYRDIERVVYKDVDQVVKRVIPREIHRRIPVTIEAEATFDFELAELQAKRKIIRFPLSVPRFIEVPIAAELMTPAQRELAFAQIAEAQELTKTAASLQKVETFARKVQQTGLTSQVEGIDRQATIAAAWQSNNIQITA